MSKINRILFTILILLAVSNFSKAQEKPAIPINTAVENVQKFFTVYPVEKIHLHFDKPYYAVGDTLWFKTYLNTNLFNYDPSKVAYIEILNSRDSLMQTLRVPLKDGAGKGQLVLDPQFWSQDNYRVRAYTKWMMNFDMGYFYNKVIPIGDAINKKLGSDVSFEPDGNKTKAILQFRDRQGQLLSRKKLSWEANDGWDPFDKGKGETDALGRVVVSLSNKEKEKFKNGRLVVKLEDGETLVGQYPLRNAIWEADVQFFPEGGDLISGISKKVAFKAVSSTGLGLKVKGKIIDSKKQEVASFEDLGLGMGSFNLVPVSGESYKAMVTFENGEQKTFDLPAVVDNKVNVVFAKQEGEFINLGIVTNDSHFQAVQNKPFYVFGQLNGHLVYAAQASMKSAAVSIRIPIKELPNGIVQITLLSPDGEPLSERLVFIQPQKLIDIQVKTDKDSYARKDLVKMKLNVNSPVDSLIGNYSVSVIDESKVPFNDDNDRTIVSSMLLTSDLKGYVEKPNYYFNEKNTNRLEALDALMMTQGFRRFDYKELVQGKLPQVRFMPEQGITLSGILRLNTGRPQPNGGLLLTIPGAAVKKDTYTDKNGVFKFENLVFQDSLKATINARGNDNFRNLVINMDQTFYPEVDQNSPYFSAGIQNIDQNMSVYLDNSKKEFRTSILIDEVVVTATQEKKQSSKDFSALSGLSMPDHRIEGSRLQGCNVLSMCLNTLLTGITYDVNTLKYYVTRNYNQGSRVPVQFFLNGMPIDEPSLNSITIPEIEGIEIFLRDDLGTVRNIYQNDGVVSIITKKEKKQPRMTAAQIEAMLPKSNVVELHPLGYVKQRAFYTPKYATPESKNTNDYRTTVYWNPEIRVEKNGEIDLEFFNADGTGKYKVVVEGNDIQGNVGRKVYYYNVK
ncbi:carboxypeptidase regulatory-like domain-containing protein [Sphingobacterium hotanense]|uniref:Carboxypeptidase regulatory-like domain-containing protein n=1 Tax=Sphingobacterium hotanense TaxID=649196 RepID=A0ABT7NT76_9SPHI|nr:carboxypeptidase regulatory-like domain-containing protein [Sphingobacterium hotanense]MDM1050168.1 carboxypeptidase regulatory-like domain-containing protein [Sphingobacterium hotanense]